jgi:hypothetical protein
MPIVYPVRLMTSFIPGWLRLTIATFALLTLTPALSALIIFDGATGNTTDPGDGVPWDNVGNTGVYLGAYNTGYWIITANHVGSSAITLNGLSYSSVGGTAARIGTTDLLLYQIDISTHGAPALPNLQISTSTPVVGAQVLMIGDGSGTKTWGTNNVASYSNYNLVVDGPTTIGLITTYDDLADEAQAQGGDSGGAVYFKLPNDSWLLSGIISAVGSSEGTDFTASIAVAAYHSDIITIVGTAVPEPAHVAIWLGSAMLLVVTSRRRRVTSSRL